MEVEGFDTQAIARGEEQALPRVPHGECEHTVEPVEAFLAELLVEVEQDFRIRAGDQPVTRASELLSQLDVVVDLPVEDDPQRAVVVGHRLVTRRCRVEYREATNAEADITLEIQPSVVGPAVRQAITHPLEQRRRDRRAVGAHHSYDAAHGFNQLRARRLLILARRPARTNEAPEA